MKVSNVLCFLLFFILASLDWRSFFQKAFLRISGDKGWINDGEGNIWVFWWLCMLQIHKLEDVLSNPEVFLFLTRDFSCTENNELDRNHVERHVPSQTDTQSLADVLKEKAQSRRTI